MRVSVNAVDRTAAGTRVTIGYFVTCLVAGDITFTVGIARVGTRQLVQPQNPADADIAFSEKIPQTTTYTSGSVTLVYPRLPAGDYVPVSANVVCAFNLKGYTSRRDEDPEVTPRGEQVTIADKATTPTKPTKPGTGQKPGGGTTPGGGSGNAKLMGRIVLHGLGATIVTPQGLKVRGTPGPRLIASGSRIVAGALPVSIEFGDGSQVVVNAGASFVISTTSKSSTGGAVFKQQRGIIWWKLKRGSRHRIHGWNAQLAIRGTAFTVETSAQRDHVQVYEGSVVVDGEGGPGTVVVRAGYETTVARRHDPTEPRRFKSPAKRFWENVESVARPTTTTTLEFDTEVSAPTGVKRLALPDGSLVVLDRGALATFQGDAQWFVSRGGVYIEPMESASSVWTLDGAVWCLRPPCAYTIEKLGGVTRVRNHSAEAVTVNGVSESGPDGYATLRAAGVSLALGQETTVAFGKPTTKPRKFVAPRKPFWK